MLQLLLQLVDLGVLDAQLALESDEVCLDPPLDLLERVERPLLLPEPSLQPSVLLPDAVELSLELHADRALIDEHLSLLALELADNGVLLLTLRLEVADELLSGVQLCLLRGQLLTLPRVVLLQSQ